MYKKPITMSCDWSTYEFDEGVLYQIEGDYKMDVETFHTLLEAFLFLMSTGYPVKILSEIEYATDHLHDEGTSC
jgi:hypothetical protein